jgi:5'-3' exonuclease
LVFLFRPAPKNEDEMMALIFEYIDRIFSIVRPRKLLYMAIDGVVSKTQKVHKTLTNFNTMMYQVHLATSRI